VILLTRLDKSAIWINPDQVLWVTRTPDTTLTFNNGQHLMVLEDPDTLLTRLVEFRRAALRGLVMDAPPPNAILEGRE
jgi:flagellar protein FlbD